MEPGKRWALPAWVRVLMGAFGILAALVAALSAPQAIRDAMENVPWLSQPAPWFVVVALSFILVYVAIRTGYSPPTEHAIARSASQDGATASEIPRRRALLIEFCRRGQNVLAMDVDSNENLYAWISELRSSNDFLFDSVFAALEQPDQIRLRHADPEGIPFERAFNDHHALEWRKLKRRVSEAQNLLGDIIVPVPLQGEVKFYDHGDGYLHTKPAEAAIPTLVVMKEQFRDRDDVKFLLAVTNQTGVTAEVLVEVTGPSSNQSYYLLTKGTNDRSETIEDGDTARWLLGVRWGEQVLLYHSIGVVDISLTQSDTGITPTNGKQVEFDLRVTGTTIGDSDRGLLCTVRHRCVVSWDGIQLTPLASDTEAPLDPAPEEERPET